MDQETTLCPTCGEPSGFSRAHPHPMRCIEALREKVTELRKHIAVQDLRIESQIASIRRLEEYLKPIREKKDKAAKTEEPSA